MCKSSKKLLKVMFLAVCLTLVISSGSQAFVTYYGGYAPYSNLAGNPGTGAYANMMARGMGAYAFTDYASAWGLANLSQMGMATGLAGLGMGLGGLNALNTWSQTYPAAPMYGYGSSYVGNPWMNYSGSSYLGGYNPVNYSFPSQSYPINSYNFPSSTLYNYGTGLYSPYDYRFSLSNTDDDDD